MYVYDILCVAMAAKDLKMIVGCDLGDEVIETIFSEFDENSDGLIDFE